MINKYLDKLKKHGSARIQNGFMQLTDRNVILEIQEQEREERDKQTDGKRSNDVCVITVKSINRKLIVFFLVFNVIDQNS